MGFHLICQTGSDVRLTSMLLRFDGTRVYRLRRFVPYIEHEYRPVVQSHCQQGRTQRVEVQRHHCIFAWNQNFRELDILERVQGHSPVDHLLSEFVCSISRCEQVTSVTLLPVLRVPRNTCHVILLIWRVSKPPEWVN